MADTSENTKTEEELAAEEEARNEAARQAIREEIAALEAEKAEKVAEKETYEEEQRQLTVGKKAVDDAVATLDATDGAKASYDYITKTVDTYWTIEGSDVAATAKGSMLDSLSELSTDLDTTNGCIGQTITEITDKVQERLTELAKELIPPLEERIKEIDADIADLEAQLAAI